MTHENMNDMAPKQIAEYSPVEAALNELRAKFTGVIFQVETKGGMKDAKDVRSKLIKLRTGLEAVRKDIKEPALRRTQAIDAEAKAITAAIKAIEEPIDAQIKVEENRIEAEKAAQAAKVAEIQRQIDGIRGLPLALAGASAEEIEAEINALDEFVPPADVFGELLEDCELAIDETLAALKELYGRMLSQELAAEQVEEQRIALEAQASVERAAMAAEREAMDEERRAFMAEREAFKAEKAAAISAVARGAEAEPAVTEEVYALPEVEVLTEVAETVLAEADADPEAPVADWRIRQTAMHTADQFAAFARKCHACGATAFAGELLSAAGALRIGQFDGALAAANAHTLMECDTALLDATIACIDVLDVEEAREAA